jgi:hypothetical protein
VTLRQVALAAAGINNPVPTLMTTVLEHLTPAIGPQSAARLIMSEHLADDDRAVLRDLVLGIEPPPGRSGL